MKQLFCDCKTDDEKSAFFLSGRAVETGVIAQAISSDVAMAYHRCSELKKELEVERMRLAACGVAALGYFNGCAKEYESSSLYDVMELRAKNEELRAKIAEMEKQEPAGYGVRYVEPTNGEEDWDSIWKYRVFAEDHIKDFTQTYADVGEPVGASTVVPLYALPGAQPAPSIPEGWKLVPIEPTEKMINDGTCASTLPGPRYIDSACAKQCWANMLAATPEAKP